LTHELGRVRPVVTPEAFVSKWRAASISERAAAQSHFIDLCRLLQVPNPVEADPTGATYAFEKAVQKAARGRGFADVWKKDAFAWEYKGRGKDLGDAYRQLLLYRDDLGNPPLLVVSDLDRIEVHTNFTGTTKAVHVFTLDDLLDPKKRSDLRLVWTNPLSFDPKLRRERITEAATNEIGRIALGLRDRGHEPQSVAHFMMQLVFALFAEDIRLLPNRLVTKILERANNPERVQDYLSQLFRAMSTGGEVILEDVPFFNGGLFDGSDALPLTGDEITILHEAAVLDWAEVEPSIFGTLFERSLDPAKRSQLGAHYTSRDDILRIVEPVVMQPLRRRWQEIRSVAEAFLQDPPVNPKTDARKRKGLVDGPITAFLHDLHQLRVLDPACGSGNFLYIALQTLKDLENEVVTFAEQVGTGGFRLVGPRQFHGIEINPFARELASMVVWIGSLQWNRANGISNVQRPVLEPLQNIRLMDALLDEDGNEQEWPEAEYIVGNPPFLGDRRMRGELGHAYVEQLRYVFRDRLPASSDLVCYWFEKARAAIERCATRRAGLIATSSITAGSNATVLERIVESGGIFDAWRDEPWVLEGAAVRVSIVSFDDGTEANLMLNGDRADRITARLTSGVELRTARVLRENRGVSFVGVQKGGEFDIDEATALSWADLPNPDGACNRDVLRRFVGGDDVLSRDGRRWIIDFSTMPESEASRFAVPFAHVVARVKPVRDRARRNAHRVRWWRHHDTRPALRAAIGPLERYILTPFTSKHRVFVWMSPDILPSNAAVAIAAEDDYTFGVLHSHIHEVWSLAMGSRIGFGNDPRYTPSTCFETFPFPHPTDDERLTVSVAAAHLNAVRLHLLGQDPNLTMTLLYNEVVGLRASRDPAARAFPLLLAHETLDAAVSDAYGWPWPMEDEEILSRLLELNLERSGAEAP
jgi:hypothetical protein